MLRKVAIACLLSLVACQSPQPPASTPTPTPIANPKEQATQAFQQFGTTLKGELEAAMKEGGPANAVKVCKTIAPQIAHRVSREHGFPMGRSSHKLRNPANAPEDAVKAYLEKYAGQPAKEAKVEVYPGEEHTTVVAPIAAQPLCLTCHGDPATFGDELKAALGENYPEDQATGFEAGDLRGVFWARVPQARLEIPGSVPLDGPNSRRIETH